MCSTSRSAQLTFICQVWAQLTPHSHCSRHCSLTYCYTKDTVLQYQQEQIQFGCHGLMVEHGLASALHKFHEYLIFLGERYTVHFHTVTIPPYLTLCSSSVSLMSPYTFPNAMHNAMHSNQLGHLRKYHSPTPTNTTALTSLPIFFIIRLF